MPYKKIIVYAYLVGGLLPALTLLTRKVKKETWPEIKYIALFAYLIAFASSYEFIATMQFHVNSTVWFKVYTLMEFLCIFYFFRKLFGRRYTWFNAYMPSFLLLFVSLQVYWLLRGNANTDSWLAMLETLLVYTAAFLWFRDIFTNMSLKTLWDSPAFYFISGFVLYFSGTLFLFLLTDFVFTPEEMGRYWVINVVLSLLLSIIISFGIWKGTSSRYSG